MLPVQAPAPAVTELLRAAEAGQAGARDELMTAVYAEMHRLAQRMLSGDRARRKLSPIELVQGAALKLMVQQKLAARDRAHFIACSARLMRQVLNDHLKRERSAARSAATRVTLVSTLAEEPKEELDFEALHAALDRLAAVSSEQSRLVELRYFGGMTIEEIAELDGTSAASIKSSWNAARAGLQSALTAPAA
jgi:RNA polymerase sigma factor (TIGR02999 family)